MKNQKTPIVRVNNLKLSFINFSDTRRLQWNKYRRYGI